MRGTNSKLETRNPKLELDSKLLVMSTDTQNQPAYRRILLKISGEALMGEQTFGIDVNVARSVAEEIKQVHDLGVQVAVVVGGGNIFRGLSKSAGNMDRSSADYIGMLATVMNAVVLQDALENYGHSNPRTCRRSIFLNSPNHLFAAGPSVIWKRGASSSLPPAPAILSFQPIRPRPCARSKSRPR